jgi:hypothetical protein
MLLSQIMEKRKRIIINPLLILAVLLTLKKDVHEVEEMDKPGNFNPSITMLSTSTLYKNRAPQFNYFEMFYNKNGYTEFYDRIQSDPMLIEKVKNLIIFLSNIRLEKIREEEMMNSLMQNNPDISKSEMGNIRNEIRKFSETFNTENIHLVAEALISIFYYFKQNEISASEFTSDDLDTVVNNIISSIEKNTKENLLTKKWEIWLGLDGNKTQVANTPVKEMLSELTAEINLNGGFFNINTLVYKEKVEAAQIDEKKERILAGFSDTTPVSKVFFIAGHGLPDSLHLNEGLAIKTDEIKKALDKRYSDKEVQKALSYESDVFIIYSCYSAEVMNDILKYIKDKGYPVKIATLTETEWGYQLGLACMPFDPAGLAPYKLLLKNKNLFEILSKQGNFNLGSNLSIYIMINGKRIKVSDIKNTVVL